MHARTERAPADGTQRRERRAPVTPRFHRLRVAEVRQETPEAVSIRFVLPPELAEAYRFAQGQFLTLRAHLEGQEVRRSYSICSGVDEGELRVAVKRVSGGAFSTFAATGLKAGDAIDVMTPEGRFFVPLDPAHRKHYVAFAAGSGITPVISLIKTTLAREPGSRFTLVYGNRTVPAILFREELEDVKDRHLGRFTLYHVLSREHQEVELFNGRIDAAKCAELLDTLIPSETIDEAFVCGPAGMLDDVRGALLAHGVAESRIHVERFAVPGEPVRPRPPRPPEELEAGPAADVTVVVHGQQRHVRVPFEGESVLEVALHAGADLPYACKAGVCCTCRARVLEGEVRMDKNYALEPHELECGFVLTCQSHPVSDRVVVSFDER